MIYVDDFLAVGPTSVLENVLKRIVRQSVHQSGWTKFCGMELKGDEDRRTLRVDLGAYAAP